jgi:hypothetical protein
VDDNSEYDDLEAIGQDAQEEWFEGDSPRTASESDANDKERRKRALTGQTGVQDF